jgi:perosamine synthetase
VTNDAQVAMRVRELKDHGRAVRGTGGADSHPVFGFNFKLTNVHAAIGLAQLDRLEERMAHVRNLEDWYVEELEGAEPELHLVGGDRAGGEAHAWVDALAAERDALLSYLREREIDPREFWHPLHTQPVYEASGDGFPNATWVSSHGFWLPSALSLSREDVAAVGVSIRKHVRSSHAPALRQ